VAVFLLRIENYGRRGRFSLPPIFFLARGGAFFA